MNIISSHFIILPSEGVWRASIGSFSSLRVVRNSSWTFASTSLQGGHFWALGRVKHVKIAISNGFPINKIKLLSNALITINKGNEGWGGSVLIVCPNKKGRQGKTCQDSTLLWFRHKGHWDESWAALTAVMSMELAPWTFFRRVDQLSESWSKLPKNFFSGPIEGSVGRQDFKWSCGFKYLHDKLLEIFIGKICTIFLVPILIFLDASNLLSDENLNSAITKVYAAMSDTRQLMVHIEHLWIGHVVSIVYVLKGSSQLLLINLSLRGLSPSLCRILLPKLTDQSLKVVFDSFPNTPYYLCTMYMLMMLIWNFLWSFWVMEIHSKRTQKC